MRDRSRDINLQIGISDQAGESSFTQTYPYTGLSTFLKKEDFNKQMCTAVESTVQYSVQCKKLEEVLKKHIKHDKPIQFLKVDVEGFERKVLLSNN